MSSQRFAGNVILQESVGNGRYHNLILKPKCKHTKTYGRLRIMNRIGD